MVRLSLSLVVRPINRRFETRRFPSAFSSRSPASEIKAWTPSEVRRGGGVRAAATMASFSSAVVWWHYACQGCSLICVDLGSLTQAFVSSAPDVFCGGPRELRRLADRLSRVERMKRILIYSTVIHSVSAALDELTITVIHSRQWTVVCLRTRGEDNCIREKWTSY